MKKTSYKIIKQLFQLTSQVRSHKGEQYSRMEDKELWLGKVPHHLLINLSHGLLGLLKSSLLTRMNTIDSANPKMIILPHAKLDWVPLYVADENAVIIGDPCHGVKIILYGIIIPSSDLYQKILNENKIRKFRWFKIQGYDRWN